MNSVLAGLLHEITMLENRCCGLDSMSEWLAFHECRSLVEKLMIEQSSYFGTVRWCDDDIITALIDKGINPNADNVFKVRCNLTHHCLEDLMVERGWESIYAVIDNLNLGKENEEGE